MVLLLPLLLLLLLLLLLQLLMLPPLLLPLAAPARWLGDIAEGQAWALSPQR